MLIDLDIGFFRTTTPRIRLVVFARALVSEAEILILDEPTSALDLKNQIKVLDWITRLSHRDWLTVQLEERELPRQ
jgi:ABC-type Mn2+/Zn2+ transport system ATPase subunit